MDRSSLSYKINIFGCGFAAFVVLLGAYTRLVDAGPGCPDWPGCYGFPTVPVAHNAVAAQLMLTTVMLVHNPGQQKDRS